MEGRGAERSQIQEAFAKAESRELSLAKGVASNGSKKGGKESSFLKQIRPHKWTMRGRKARRSGPSARKTQPL